jgi:hypothetical protein
LELSTERQLQDLKVEPYNYDEILNQLEHSIDSVISLGAGGNVLHLVTQLD